MKDIKDALREVIHTRRSTRNYRSDPVPEELLAEIVEAGRMAPSGNNNQNTHFIVVKNPEKLAELRSVLTGALSNMPVQAWMPPPMVGLIEKAKSGPVAVDYNAPVLVFTANKKGYTNAIADCSCTLENMMLMASACGIGSCWINIYHLLREASPIRGYMEKIGLCEDEEVYGALALGYTDHLDTVPLPRKGNSVTDRKSVV